MVDVLDEEKERELLARLETFRRFPYYGKFALDLHLAAHAGDLEVVKYLVEVKKVDVNITTPSQSGVTALTYAARAERFHICEFYSQTMPI